jgi:hypothetical protein
MSGARRLRPGVISGELAEAREELERMIAAQSEMMHELQISSRYLAHFRFTKIHFV